MFYIKTETENHIITTSYATEKQARRYGGDPSEMTMVLAAEDAASPPAVIDDYDPEHDDFLEVYGVVRTVFHGKKPANAGNFRLYIADDNNEWFYTGISFATYTDANQAVKGPLSGTFGSMLIVEAAEVHEPHNLA